MKNSLRLCVFAFEKKVGDSNVATDIRQELSAELNESSSEYLDAKLELLAKPDKNNTSDFYNAILVGLKNVKSDGDDIT